MYSAKELLENLDDFEPDGSDKDFLIIKLYLALQEAVAEIDKYREYGEDPLHFPVEEKD